MKLHVDWLHHRVTIAGAEASILVFTPRMCLEEGRPLPRPDARGTDNGSARGLRVLLGLRRFVRISPSLVVRVIRSVVRRLTVAAEPHLHMRARHRASPSCGALSATVLVAVLVA